MSKDKTHISDISAHEASANEQWSDPDDAPEITDELLARAELWIGEKLVRSPEFRSNLPQGNNSGQEPDNPDNREETSE